MPDVVVTITVYIFRTNKIVAGIEISNLLHTLNSQMDVSLSSLDNFVVLFVYYVFDVVPLSSV